MGIKPDLYVVHPAGLGLVQDGVTAPRRFYSDSLENAERISRHCSYSERVQITGVVSADRAAGALEALERSRDLLALHRIHAPATRGMITEAIAELSGGAE